MKEGQDRKYEKLIISLVNYLKNFGGARFTDAEFYEDGRIKDYPAIELIAEQKFKDGLDHHINSNLNEEKGGHRAYLRFIALAEEKNGKFLYLAEVIPQDNVPLREVKDVFKNYLRSLPRTLDDFRQKHYANPCRQR
jgi:hypothetical protein